MSDAIDNLSSTLQYAMKIRPPVGGFPYLAEALRAAGVTRNIWQLPACQSLYVSARGPVIHQGTPLVTGFVEVPRWNHEDLIRAVRTDQAGQSTFPEFLDAAWKAGVVRYEVDFAGRFVTYYGGQGEEYREDYPAVTLAPLIG